MKITKDKPKHASTFITQDPQDIGLLLKNTRELEKTSTSSLLHKKLREVKEMDDKLASMKENYTARMLKVQEGEQRFLTKQAEMRKSIMAFEKHIVDRDNKRSHAIRKTTEQRRFRDSKVVVIANLNASMTQLKRKHTTLLGRLGILKRYEHYLSEVVSGETQWENIDELLNRYRVLVTAHDDLHVSVQEGGRQVEHYQNLLQQLEKDNSNEVLVKNSIVARLLKRLEDATAARQKAESDAQKVELTTKAIISRLASVQMTTVNLYDRVQLSYEHRRPKSVEKNMEIEENYEQKLGYFCELLNELAERLIELECISKDCPTEISRAHHQSISCNALGSEKKDLKREQTSLESM